MYHETDRYKQSKVVTFWWHDDIMASTGHGSMHPPKPDLTDYCV